MGLNLRRTNIIYIYEIWRESPENESEVRGQDDSETQVLLESKSF